MSTMIRFIEVTASILSWSAIVLLTLAGGADLILGDWGPAAIRLFIASILFALVISR